MRGLSMCGERDTAAVSNPWSLRKTSAGRSPTMTQGAMVLTVVTRGIIDPSAMSKRSRSVLSYEKLIIVFRGKSCSCQLCWDPNIGSLQPLGLDR